MKFDFIKSVKTGVWYGVPASGAAKFGSAVSGLFWPYVSGVAEIINRFGIPQLFGMPDSVMIDKSWLASIFVFVGIMASSTVMSAIKFFYRKYIAVK